MLRYIIAEINEFLRGHSGSPVTVGPQETPEKTAPPQKVPISRFYLLSLLKTRSDSPGAAPPQNFPIIKHNLRIVIQHSNEPRFSAEFAQGPPQFLKFQNHNSSDFYALSLGSHCVF